MWRLSAPSRPSADAPFIKAPLLCRRPVRLGSRPGTASSCRSAVSLAPFNMKRSDWGPAVPREDEDAPCTPSGRLGQQGPFTRTGKPSFGDGGRHTRHRILLLSNEPPQRLCRGSERGPAKSQPCLLPTAVVVVAMALWPRSLPVCRRGDGDDNKGSGLLALQSRQL
ncbi:unnamed protein product [Boreogadus saida]